MKKVFLLTIGFITMGLGFLGVFLPVLPTTPFLLVSLACFMRSSERMHQYVMNNKYLAPYVKEYASSEGIPKRAKIRAIFLIWITISFTAFVVIDKVLLRVMLYVIAISVTTYIWTRKTAEAAKTEEI